MSKSCSRVKKIYSLIFVLYRVFQEMLYGIQAGFGSPQVPVAELLARPAPTLLSPQKPKSSNFLQVPDMESPRYVLTIKIVVVMFEVLVSSKSDSKLLI